MRERMYRRFTFNGTKEQQKKLEATLSQGISRKAIYMILKYLSISPDYEKILQEEFPDV